MRLATVACNLDQHILESVLPLLESEKVQALEWSFDALFRHSNVPEWFTALLQAFGKEGRLIGHGVFFSLFSGRWSPEQTDWLTHLRATAAVYQFDHITEHFGFMTGANFHQGAPISIPFNRATLALGRDRLLRISDACRCPVGLENLAFSYALEEVKRHGDFLAQLVQPANGFIILDLHNLYCQIHNFEIDDAALMALYPLELVREIHISGGSWEHSSIEPGQTIRRDTHDDRVPEAVFELLEKALPRCPNLKFVVMEQLGTGLKTPEAQASYQQDFYRMESIVAQFDATNDQKPIYPFLPVFPPLPNTPFSDELLYQQQRVLSQVLETSPTFAHAQANLQASILAHSDWRVEAWKPAMLETALAIAQKWK